MENLEYLFAAYTLIWSLIFGYIFTLYRRQKRLEEDLKHLEAGYRDQEND